MFHRRFADGAWGYVPVTAPEVEPTPEPVPTPSMVIAERQRRLSLGFAYDFGDERGIHKIGTTAADMAGWDEVSKIAQAAIATGNPDRLIGITTDSGPVQVTAMEWQAVLLAAGDHRQPIFAASFALQTMDPIPMDYADDTHWS
jgi:hypothetical protein